MRRQLAFKADADTVAYLEQEAEEQGWTLTAVLHDMVTTQIELERALGDRWLEIAADAVRSRKSKGELLAELVLPALAKRK